MSSSLLFSPMCNICLTNIQPCLKEYSITACLNLRSCVILAIVSCAPFVFFAQLNNKLNRAKLTTFFAIPRLPLGGGFLFGFRLFFLPLLLVTDMRLCNKCIVNLHSRRIRLYKLLLTGKVKCGNIKLTISFTSNILFGVNDKIISTYE